MTISNTRDNLLLYFNIENAFRENIVTAVNSGVTISFSIPVTVHRPRSFWFDKKLKHEELVHTLKYDTLKKDYVVTRSWKTPEEVTLKSFDEAKKLMTRVDGLTLLSLEDLEKGEHYRIGAKAQLKKISRPYYLKYVLFFLTFWDFETDWKSIDFIY